MIPKTAEGGSRPRHTLITGLPGVGKTTLIRKLAKRLAEFGPTGFYTEEIRNERGIREPVCDRRASRVESLL
ncbi:nucleoside-triphosphatase [Petrachloros mirabilis]